MKRILFVIFSVVLVQLTSFSQTVNEVKISGARGVFVDTEKMVERGLTTSSPSCKVVSFRITAEVFGQLKKYYALNNQFPEEFVKDCSLIKSNSKLLIDSIKVIQNDKPGMASALSLIVKRNFPESYIGSFQNRSELSVSDILFRPYLNSGNKRIKITAFQALVVNNENVKQYVSLTDSFPAELVTEIEKLKGGEVVWFQNIKGLSDSNSVNLLPFKISVLGSSDDYPCTISGISFGEIEKSKITDGLELKTPSKEMVIESFLMSANDNGVTKYFRQSNGAKLTAEMVAYLKTAESGSLVQINQIRAVNLEVSYQLNPLFIKIAGKGKDGNRSAVGDLSFGEQTLENIKKNPKVTVNGVDANYFVVRTVNENLFTSKDGRFSPSQLEILATLPKGTVIQIYNISFVESGKRVKANDVWIRLK